MILFLIAATYRKRKGSREGVAQAAIASVQNAAASIRTEAAIAEQQLFYELPVDYIIPGEELTAEEVIVPGAREAFYGEAIRFAETIVAEDLRLRDLREPDDDPLVAAAIATRAEEVVAVAAHAVLPTLVAMTPSPEPAKHSGDTDRSNASTVIGALGGIASRFDRERSQSLPPMTPSPDDRGRRVTFAEQLDLVDAPTASSVVATLAPQISALTNAFAADRVRRESNASPSETPVAPPVFVTQNRPRSTASQRRIREAQERRIREAQERRIPEENVPLPWPVPPPRDAAYGDVALSYATELSQGASQRLERIREEARITTENETEWGVLALSLVIETPEYAEYLEYLKGVDLRNRAHAAEVDRLSRIENEARNNMHDVLIALLRRASLDEFEPLTSRFATWPEELPERVIEPAEQEMMDSFVEGGLTADEEFVAYEYSNAPSPYEARRRY